MPVLHTTDASFDVDVLKANIPVLVDFWATWCGPCKALAPHLDLLAAQYEGRLKVVKIEADKEPKTANEYSVTALPTLLVYKDGKVVKKHVGAANLAKLKQLIDGLI